jgi:hypothetical protein
LVSAWGVWRFEEFEFTSWRRVPETTEPSMLVQMIEAK